MNNMQKFVTELQPTDVLFGRGSGPNDHEGNVRFRHFVAERKAQYMATNHRLTKTKIAREIVDLVHAAHGRFLKKVEAKELSDLGLPEGSECYELVDDDTIMEKAKQALRQNATKVRGELDGAPSSTPPASTGAPASYAPLSLQQQQQQQYARLDATNSMASISLYDLEPLPLVNSSASLPYGITSSGSLVMNNTLGSLGMNSTTLGMNNTSGSIVMNNPSGSLVMNNPSGSHMNSPSGSLVMNNPSGSLVMNNPSGSLVMNNPSGSLTTAANPLMSNQSMSQPQSRQNSHDFAMPSQPLPLMMPNQSVPQSRQNSHDFAMPSVPTQFHGGMVQAMQHQQQQLQQVQQVQQQQVQQVQQQQVQQQMPQQIQQQQQVQQQQVQQQIPQQIQQPVPQQVRYTPGTLQQPYQMQPPQPQQHAVHFQEQNLRPAGRVEFNAVDLASANSSDDDAFDSRRTSMTMSDLMKIHMRDHSHRAGHHRAHQTSRSGGTQSNNVDELMDSFSQMRTGTSQDLDHRRMQHSSETMGTIEPMGSVTDMSMGTMGSSIFSVFRGGDSLAILAEDEPLEDPLDDPLQTKVSGDSSNQTSPAAGSTPHRQAKNQNNYESTTSLSFSDALFDTNMRKSSSLSASINGILSDVRRQVESEYPSGDSLNAMPRTVGTMEEEGSESAMGESDMSLLKSAFTNTEDDEGGNDDKAQKQNASGSH